MTELTLLNVFRWFATVWRLIPHTGTSALVGLLDNSPLPYGARALMSDHVWDKAKLFIPNLLILVFTLVRRVPSGFDLKPSSATVHGTQ